MINFNVSYYNINLNIIKKILKKEERKINKIKKILLNFELFNILKETKDLDAIKNISKKFIKNKNTFVILGTGGSSLGAKALVNLMNGKSKKKLIFFDNIDPVNFSNSVLSLNFNKTVFIIISKSGSTPETISQFSSIIELFNSKNKINYLSKNCIVITENKVSPLKRIANKLKCYTLDHDKNIGGRFSVFSNVGLLPAHLAGLNIFKIREGARNLITEMQKNVFNEHYFGSILSTNLQLKRIINSNVLMTYSDSLFYFGKWYLQLWAESIGKNNKGIVPIHSTGTTDQHSQLQLYLDGPKDKFFTLLTTDYRDKGFKMNNKILKLAKVDYLRDKTMGDLMYAEQQSTLNTLVNKGLIIREIYLSEINEYSLGQIMAYFMIETILSCFLIDVNPFNQPAVEQGKKLTKKYLLK